MAEAGISGLTMATSAQSEPKMSQERLQENRNVAFVAATHFPGFGADMSHPQDDKTISDNDRGTDALENFPLPSKT